ncbi:MAG: diphosphomevalonate decarboxylase [Bacteroidales bacterium]|nr:MAG: diphosphomevalonate decarboxylase [Bacteroidales bacterium]
MVRSGKIAWRSPSNIALVKYWGKKGFQLPLNPSVSMTLTNCYTETTIEFNHKNNLKNPAFSLLFQGKKNVPFESKIRSFIEVVSKEFPALSTLNLDISTHNSFPHSAGIASSASSLSALALCLLSIKNKVLGINMNEEDFLKKASYLARLGSGSASRSVYGGWVLWGETSGIEGSSDDYAIPLSNQVDEKFNSYYDSILIVSSGEKAISSSQGHELMESNPYKESRVNTGRFNAINLIDALKCCNEKVFGEIVEYEAANLHAMFLTSHPSFILIKPETLQIINKLKQFRDETKLEFTFTLDAGPNIHLLYSEDIRDKMLLFINTDLTALCEDGKWIDDKVGMGPILIDSN